MDNILNVEEAKTRLIYELSIITGFKYLKSGVLKKTIKDIVFEINFFFSKWNVSGQNIEINADLRLIYFVADNLGKEIIKDKAQQMYDALSDEEKEQVVQYQNGVRNKSWMLNRCNLKYIVDNNIF